MSRITPRSSRWWRRPGQRLGGLDILINNAGVIDPIAEIATSDPAAWARNISINLIGAYNVVRAVLPGMLAGGGGSIVNVSSGAAYRPLEGWSAYCAGKAGLAMLTQAIALETAGKGIRVFGFSPGTIDTEMQVKIRASGMNVSQQDPARRPVAGRACGARPAPSVPAGRRRPGRPGRLDARRRLPPPHRAGLRRRRPPRKASRMADRYSAGCRTGEALEQAHAQAAGDAVRPLTEGRGRLGREERLAGGVEQGEPLGEHLRLQVGQAQMHAVGIASIGAAAQHHGRPEAA